MTEATDWDLYYQESPVTSRFTRPILFGRVLICSQLPIMRSAVPALPKREKNEFTPREP